MQKIDKIRSDISAIKERNKRVETDKAWETSWLRKFLIAFLTYIVIVLFFYAANLPKPLINAIVPTMGFLLSTLTINFAKKLWIKYIFKRGRK
jgi:hypothetical protein